jgi:hypothetical protein
MVEVTLVLISASKKESPHRLPPFPEDSLFVVDWVELLCAVLGNPTACLYLKVLRIGWSCCSQA